MAAAAAVQMLDVVVSDDFCVMHVQKVFFEMQSDVTTTKYRSLVRSCAERCEDQDDFANCSTWQLTTMGCVRRTCCDDEDLCNAATQRHLASAGWGLVVTVAVCCSLLFVLVS